MSEKSVQLDLNDLAPISVSVYTRLEHFKQCIESLANNHLAKHSKLYVFSDAAKPGDEEGVQQVREYAKTITGFKEVVLKFQETNGYLKNMADAREIPLEAHGKIIRLEDDIVSAPYFLDFINEGLVLYKDNPKVHGISGYMLPGYDREVLTQVFLKSCPAWGIGYWADTKPLSPQDAQSLAKTIMSDWQRYKKISYGSPHVPSMVLSVAEGRLVAGDVANTMFMYEYDRLGVLPSRSLVRNIGYDGSGVHCGEDKDKAGERVYCGKVFYDKNKLVRLNEEDKNFLFSAYGGYRAHIKNLARYFFYNHPYVYSFLKASRFVLACRLLWGKK